MLNLDLVENKSLNEAKLKNCSDLYLQFQIKDFTSPELPPIAVQYRCHVSPSISRDQYTALLLVEVLVT